MKLIQVKQKLDVKGGSVLDSASVLRGKMMETVIRSLKDELVTHIDLVPETSELEASLSFWMIEEKRMEAILQCLKDANIDPSPSSKYFVSKAITLLTQDS